MTSAHVAAKGSDAAIGAIAYASPGRRDESRWNAAGDKGVILSFGPGQGVEIFDRRPRRPDSDTASLSPDQALQVPGGFVLGEEREQLNERLFTFVADRCVNGRTALEYFLGAERGNMSAAGDMAFVPACSQLLGELQSWRERVLKGDGDPDELS